MTASATPLNVRGDGIDGSVATLAGPTAPAAETTALATPNVTPGTAPLTSAVFGASAGAEGPATASAVLERGVRERRELWAERLTALVEAVAEEGEAVEEVEEDLDREGR